MINMSQQTDAIQLSKIAQLELMLVKIANFCTVISCNSIVRYAASVDAI